ncbi:sulfurtransferase TusA family protein [Glacieibacterium sp.]|uniref:sulfurtransferase TusA family protein n=1 Tax=Glacieibacterium sp. TaxID=2860237 RepID=UPI003AFFE618
MTTTQDIPVVDAQGLRCPLPVLKLARAMRLAPETGTFALISDDPGTATELAAWCAQAGHGMVAQPGRFVVSRG